MSQRRSVWLATATSPSYPPLDGDLDVDVAVVGAGITGLTTALLVQRSGARVAVVEAATVAAGTTGNTTGKVTSQHGLAYQGLIDGHGEHRARLYAEANQRAIEIVAELVDETAADCQFERAPAYLYARTPGGRRAIEGEHAAAIRLGLPATLTSDVDLPFPVESALRFDGQAHIHPGRYCAALAATFTQRGGTIVEHTRAVDVTERPDRAIVSTPAGDVHAEHVVIATLLPFADRGGFFAKARPVRSYGIAARLRGDAPAGMHIDIGSPGRSTRPWLNGGRRGLIVVGAGHPTGQGDPTPGRWGDLERWAGDNFEVESFEYRWSAQDYATMDGIPYVGRSPRMARTFVATGFKKWGLTNGTAAAQMLANLIAGRDDPWIEVFDATRIGDATTVKQLVEYNLQVGKQLVAGRVGRLHAQSIEHLQPGEGGPVKLDGETVGAYREADGTMHAVSITCTHLGCTLRWNGAETSWDCPCHGSRFAYDGQVLNAPAVRPLGRIAVEGATDGE